MQADLVAMNTAMAYVSAGISRVNRIVNYLLTDLNLSYMFIC